MRCAALFLLSFAVCLGCSGAPAPNAVPTSAAIAASGEIQPVSTVAGAADGDATGKPKISRQIIYRATLLLYVQDFGAADQQIQTLIKDSGGYIAKFREDRPTGSIRGGKWTA